MKIVFEHLTKRFPSRKKNSDDVIAVADFNFEIPDGTLVGLLGPSGCGKSTTLNLICGLLNPTEGRIYFGEDDVTTLPAEHRGVGMVFQNYALYPHLTVRQNITFPLENLRGKDKMSREEMNAKALEVARLVELEELMDRRPSELSGGQQQRVAIARALVKMPRVLLLDEPLSNLDARLRLATREEIRRIQRQTGITTVFVTHDQDEAMSISDLIVVMKDGIVQQIGAPQSVYDDPCNRFVAEFLGTPPINIFEGKIKDGKIFIGEDAVLAIGDGGTRAISSDDTDSPHTEQIGTDGEREVYIGIRPEGFILAADGELHASVDRLEVMGRDISVVCSHSAFVGETLRAIISAENLETLSGRSDACFRLKKNKVFVFDKKTEKRIYIDLL